MIAERGAVSVGWHLETGHARLIDVDYHPLDHGDSAVTRERIFPRREPWMSDARRRQIHLTDPALILLERCDFLRVGRPDQYWAIALDPAGIVGRIAKVLLPISR